MKSQKKHMVFDIITIVISLGALSISILSFKHQDELENNMLPLSFEIKQEEDNRNVFNDINIEEIDIETLISVERNIRVYKDVDYKKYHIPDEFGTDYNKLLGDEKISLIISQGRISNAKIISNGDDVGNSIRGVDIYKNDTPQIEWSQYIVVKTNSEFNLDKNFIDPSERREKISERHFYFRYMFFYVESDNGSRDVFLLYQPFVIYKKEGGNYLYTSGGTRFQTSLDVRMLGYAGDDKHLKMYEHYDKAVKGMYD